MKNKDKSGSVVGVAKPVSGLSSEQSGEVVSFESAGHSHVHARKEKKFERIQSAFKAVTDEKFGAASKKNSKKNKNKNKKNKKR